MTTRYLTSHSFLSGCCFPPSPRDDPAHQPPLLGRLLLPFVGHGPALTMSELLSLPELPATRAAHRIHQAETFTTVTFKEELARSHPEEPAYPFDWHIHLEFLIGQCILSDINTTHKISACLRKHSRVFSGTGCQTEAVLICRILHFSTGLSFNCLPVCFPYPGQRRIHNSNLLLPLPDHIANLDLT